MVAERVRKMRAKVAHFSSWSPGTQDIFFLASRDPELPIPSSSHRRPGRPMTSPLLTQVSGKGSQENVSRCPGTALTDPPGTDHPAQDELIHTWCNFPEALPSNICPLHTHPILMPEKAALGMGLIIPSSKDCCDS